MNATAAVVVAVDELASFGSSAQHFNGTSNEAIEGNHEAKFHRMYHQKPMNERDDADDAASVTWPELFPFVTRKISEFKLKKFRRLCSLLMSCHHNVPLNAARNKPPNRRKLNHANYLRKTSEREQIHNWNTFVSVTFLLVRFYFRLANVLPLLSRSLSLSLPLTVVCSLFSVILCCFECASVWKWLRKQM